MIVNHYLNGNRYAHLDYFINKIINNEGDIIEKIRTSYIKFMKISVKKQDSLKMNFNFNEISYLFHKILINYFFMKLKIILLFFILFEIKHYFICFK